MSLLRGSVRALRCACAHKRALRLAGLLAYFAGSLACSACKGSAHSSAEGVVPSERAVASKRAVSSNNAGAQVASAAEPIPLRSAPSEAGSQSAALLPARAASPPEAVAIAPTLPSPAHSTSFGSPSNGRLEGGVPLPLIAPGLRFNDRRDASARYATVEVVQAIQTAALAVATRFPQSELVVNDLSLPSGGRIAHHGSHRAGRDADILFYLRGDDGAYTPSVGTPIDPAGIGFDFKDLSDPHDDVRVHFDAARTWSFVAALLEDRDAPVQRIFVAEHLREKLLAAARQAGTKPATAALFADVTCQPSYPHDDHLHVRWFCSVEDLRAGCEDLPPIYPWHSEALAAAGVEATLASRTRALDPAPTTSNEEAEREVKRQKPHKDVLSFLARRKAWEKQPHPGRTYCR